MQSCLFVFLKYFLMWTICEVRIEFVTILFLFYVFLFVCLFVFYGQEAYGISAQNQGLNQDPLHWKAKS